MFIDYLPETTGFKSSFRVQSCPTYSKSATLSDILQQVQSSHSILQHHPVDDRFTNIKPYPTFTQMLTWSSMAHSGCSCSSKPYNYSSWLHIPHPRVSVTAHQHFYPSTLFSGCMYHSTIPTQGHSILSCSYNISFNLPWCLMMAPQSRSWLHVSEYRA